MDQESFSTDDRWTLDLNLIQGAALEPITDNSTTPLNHVNNLWTPYLDGPAQYQRCDDSDFQPNAGPDNDGFSWTGGNLRGETFTRPPFSAPRAPFQQTSVPDRTFDTNCPTIANTGISFHSPETLQMRNQTVHTFSGNVPALLPWANNNHQPSDNVALHSPSKALTEKSDSRKQALVIRDLQRQLKQKDAELKLKDDIIRNLLQQQEKPIESGKASHRGTKRSYKQFPSPLGAVSDSEGNTRETALVPGKRCRFDEIARQKTAETRDYGACIRCRRIKKRCEMGEDPTAPCEACRRLKLQYLRIPCIRTHIVDINIFRTGTTENDTWTTRNEIYKLNDLNTYISTAICRKVELTHDWGPPLEITVREYLPVKGDETSYKWTSKDGQQHEFPMPHYAIADLSKTKTAIDKYIIRNMSSYVEAHLDEGNFPLWESFKLSIQRSIWKRSILLQNALKLWMAARLIEKPWRICGDETLGMTPPTDKSSPWCGWIPITPIMDTQLDQIVIKAILIPLRREVLQMLQSKIEKFQNIDWFEIFAVIMILLNTIELGTAHDHEFANMFGHVHANGGTRFEDYNLVESYFHAAQTLIAHFRDTLHAYLPFIHSKTDFDVVVKKGELGPAEAGLLQELRFYFNDNEKRTALQNLKRQHQYESPMYWAHQLFMENWDGKQVQIQEIKK